MRSRMARITRIVVIVFTGIVLAVFLQASAVLAGPPDFTKPYMGIKPTTGTRPLLVLLLGPDDPRMWDQVNVYALNTSGYIEQSIVRVTSTGRLDSWRQRVSLHNTRRFVSAPATLNSSDGDLQSVFALGDDGYIYQSYHSRLSDREEWQNWSAWSALPKTVRFTSAPAGINSPDGNLASVFALGQDGFIYQSVYNRRTGGPWQNWVRLPGDIRFNSAPAVMNSPDGSLASVFARAENGYIYQIVYSRRANGGWKEWQRLPGTLRFGSGPAVINSPDGRLAEVFALGEDGFIYQILFTRGTQVGWGKWQSLPRNIKFKSAPSVINLPDEDLTSVFALGADGYLYHVSYWRESGKGWGSWEQLPGPQRFNSAPAVTSRLAHMRTPAYYNRLIFGRSNSVRDYYLETSYRKFTFSRAYITPWLTAQDDPNTPDWDESSLRFFHFYDEQHDYARKSAWAIKQVERMTPFRFKKYDTNNDGKVTSDELAILWIYPGDADARARPTYPPVVKDNYMSAGVEIGLLARGAAGMDVGTIAHELAHEVLHLDDLYEGGNYCGVGHFSLMGYAEMESHLDPWSKMKLGWLIPTVVTGDGWQALTAIENSPKAYILYNPAHGTKEYFIVENRWPDKSYETALPDKGLAIWHIDESPRQDNSYWSRKTIQLEWAGGECVESTALWDGADPAKADWTHLNWHDYSYSGISISGISGAGPTMQAYFDIPD